MLPHRRYPFGALQRQRGERPLFDIAFNYIHFHVIDALLASGHLDVLDFKRLEPTNFGLQAHFGQGLLDARVTVQLDYDMRRIPAIQMQAIAGFYERALAAMAADPEAPHGALPLLSVAERHHVLAWNDTSAEYAGSECLLHELIEAQARRTPESLAVEIEGLSLTYGELSARSNRLARHLQRLGVGPESRVGICAERSLELVVGLLGILKAGGAYVPLDPEYPRDRLAYMLEDSGAGWVLLQERLAGVAGGSNLRQVFLDSDGEEIARESAEPLAVGGLRESLAYVIYTSGSTGRPKGAMNTHRGIVNRLLWMQSAYGLDRTDAVLQKTPVSFDVSVWELFWPLLTGARLVLARPGGHRDGGYLVERIVESGVTTVHFVPSMLRVFLATPGVEVCRSLKRLMASGEALTGELEERFFSRLGSSGCALHNLYGPTEASVDVTFWACRGDSGDQGVAIGRPIGNTGIYLLDRGLSAVPLGVPGELYIGGVNLGRGYVGRPELTAERFVPSPWGQGERLYRTGDLARHRPDGAIDYLGRTDHQVKVRGFRIELGEIETALGQYPGVRSCVVVAREEGLEERRLVAYLVAPGPPPQASDLRGFLRQSLPEFMVPAAFVVVAELPLTPSGKLDRRALPEPRRDAMDAGAFVPPRTPTEELLAGIWKALLGVERVSVDDSFFSLGGHSLLATRLLSRVRSALGVELSLRALFQEPTLAGLAARAEASREAATGVRALPLLPVSRGGDLPLSFAQQRLWFVQQMEPANPGYNMFSSFRLSGKLHHEALAACLSEIVRRHETLRTRFESRDGAPVQVIMAPRPVALPLVDLGGLPAARRAAVARRVVDEQAHRPFDLAGDVLLRPVLLRFEEAEHLATFVIHHIVSDAWSLAVLVGELAALYRAWLAGHPSPLAELPVQYVDFAVWQRSHLQGEVLERQISYWRERLAGAPPVLHLPGDRPRPTIRTHRGGTCNLTLPRDLAVRIEALSAREDATLFMTLLAGYQCLLGLEAGRTDVVVGTDVANRNRLETEGLIGFLVNSLVLRTDLSGNPTFREMLKRVREVCLDAYAHQDLPFDRLVEELQPERQAGISPLFQVSFNLQNAPAGQLELPGLRLSGEEDIERRAARFDLVVNMWAAEGELRSNWEYNRDLFTPARVTELTASYTQLLRLATEDPDVRWQDLGEALAASRRERTAAEGRQLKRAGRDRFAGLKRKATAVP
jgi:amino acid adenylation domain-containing protein